MFNLRDDYYCNDEFDNCGPQRGSSVSSIKHVMNEDWDEDVAGKTKHTSVMMMIKGFLSSRNGRPLSALQRKGCM